MTKEEWLQKIDEADISAQELKFFIYVACHVNDKGIFDKSNDFLCERYKVSDRTISRWVSNLQKEKLITSFHNKRKHCRIIRLCYAKKTAEDLDQSEMSPAQRKFHEAFPKRLINCEVPEYVDMDKLIEKIKASKYLSNYEFTSLRYFVNNYDAIIEGRIGGQIKEKTFAAAQERSEEEFASFVHSAEDIDIGGDENEKL